MLNWLIPKCPLDTRLKTWVERRMLWLADRFGIEKLMNAQVILPTDEFFPREFAGDEIGARKCFERMCGYMGIDPDSITLEILDEEQMPDAAGIYEIGTRSKISIKRSVISSPPHLLATIAHELAHELLLKGGHLSVEVADHEYVTDLLPIFLGAGIFAANATVVSSTVSSGNYSIFSISKQGYLSSIVFGYALSLFAFIREEFHPDWARHLRTDAAASLWKGLRYLRKTGDSLFHTDSLNKPKPLTLDDLRDRLQNRSPSFRLSALWDIAESATPNIELLAAVEKCLQDRDPDVLQGAFQLIGRYGEASSKSVPLLIDAVSYGLKETRIGAITALGGLRTSPEDVVQLLASVLKESDYQLVSTAAEALMQYGAAAGSVLPELLTALESAASVSNHSLVEKLLKAFRSINPDYRTIVRQYFVGRDSDVYRYISMMLKEQQE